MFVLCAPARPFSTPLRVFVAIRLLLPAVRHVEKLLAAQIVAALQGALAGLLGVPIAFLGTGTNLLQHGYLPDLLHQSINADQMRRFRLGPRSRETT